jgi:hypothetical protein
MITKTAKATNAHQAMLKVSFCHFRTSHMSLNPNERKIFAALLRARMKAAGERSTFTGLPSSRARLPTTGCYRSRCNARFG